MPTGVGDRAPASTGCARAMSVIRTVSQSTVRRGQSDAHGAFSIHHLNFQENDKCAPGSKVPLQHTPTVSLFPPFCCSRALPSGSYFLRSRAGDPLTPSVSLVMDSPWPTDRQQTGAEAEPCVCCPLYPRDRGV